MEIFYWQGSDGLPPVGSNPGTDKENWLEIWNDVFMQYNKIDNFYLGNVFKGDFKQCAKDRMCHSPCAELCDIELAGVKRLPGKEMA